MPRRCIHSIAETRSSSTDRSMPLRAESAWRRNWITETPGISCGYWKARNMPGLGPLVGRPVGDVVAPERDRAGGDDVLGGAHQRGGEGALARPVGAHDGVHLTGADGEVEPADDRLGLHRETEAGVDDRRDPEVLDPKQLHDEPVYAPPPAIIPTAVVVIGRHPLVRRHAGLPSRRGSGRGSPRSARCRCARPSGNRRRVYAVARSSARAAQYRASPSAAGPARHSSHGPMRRLYSATGRPGRSSPRRRSSAGASTHAVAGMLRSRDRRRRQVVGVDRRVVDRPLVVPHAAAARLGGDPGLGVLAAHERHDGDHHDHPDGEHDHGDGGDQEPDPVRARRRRLVVGGHQPRAIHSSRCGRSAPIVVSTP